MKSLISGPYYWANINTWVRFLVWLNTRRHVTGLEKIPRKGPLILASNHFSEADPPILSVLFPRRIVWMAKRELFNIPIVGIMYHLFGAIPVRRFEADTTALRQAEETIRRGLALGMFPEGTRGHGGALRKGYPGTALIALRTGAPVLPIALWGTENISLPRAFLQRTSVWVSFGEPFFLPQVERIRTAAVAEGTELIMSKIAALLPPQHRGVYAQAAQVAPRQMSHT